MSNDDFCALCASADYENFNAPYKRGVHQDCFQVLHIDVLKMRKLFEQAPLLSKDDQCGATFDLLVRAVTKNSQDFAWEIFRLRLQNFCEAVILFKPRLEDYIAKAAENVAKRLRPVLDIVRMIMNTAVAIARTQCKLEIDEVRRVSA